MNPMMMGMPGGMPGSQGGQQYNVPQVDLASAMQQFPGMDPMMLLQLIAQQGQPMQAAQQGQGAMGGEANPLLAAMMQFGIAPPQAMNPQMAY